MAAEFQSQHEFIQEWRSSVGKAIRSRRQELGLSQDELASMMEIQRSTISKVENGKFSFSIDYILRFAWYLKFEVKVGVNE